MVFDEIVGVLLDVLAVHQPPGQLEHLHGKLRVVQDLQGPLRGDLAGVVIVVAEHQFLGKAGEQAGLLHCQRRAHGGHRVVEARLVERHDVQVALAEDDVGALGLFGQVQPVEHPPLGVDWGLRRVHILGLRLVQHPAAEGHHVAPGVHHREHQAVAELVVQAAVFVLDHQPCFQQIRLGVTLFRHGSEEHVPGVQRSPHAKPYRRLPGDAAPGQVLPHRLSLRLLEQLVVKAGGVPVQVQQALAPAAGLPVSLFLRYFHACPFGQKADGVREGEVLLLHDEVHHAAAPFAAEAVIDLLVRGDGEGAGLFTVEGT